MNFRINIPEYTTWKIIDDGYVYSTYALAKELIPPNNIPEEIWHKTVNSIKESTGLTGSEIFRFRHADKKGIILLLRIKLKTTKFLLIGLEGCKRVYGKNIPIKKKPSSTSVKTRQSKNGRILDLHINKKRRQSSQVSTDNVKNSSNRSRRR